jgi:hypothetical protein
LGVEFLARIVDETTHLIDDQAKRVVVYRGRG